MNAVLNHAFALLSPRFRDETISQTLTPSFSALQVSSSHPASVFRCQHVDVPKHDAAWTGWRKDVAHLCLPPTPPPVLDASLEVNLLEKPVDSSGVSSMYGSWPSAQLLKAVPSDDDASSDDVSFTPDMFPLDINHNHGHKLQ